MVVLRPTLSKDVTEDTHNMHLRDDWDPSQFCSPLGCNGEDLHH